MTSIAIGAADAVLPLGPRRSAGLAAVLMGNALEFYDFLTFSFFATQISRSFFPGDSEQDKLLLTLATFGAGFLTRPIGGVVLGRIADRRGRKPVLLWSFAMMGFGVVGVALTPSYAAIGMAAPLLVLAFRLIQGFALGGDVGASTAYLIEQAPSHRRGLQASLQFSTQGVAVLAAGLAGSLLAHALSPARLDAWGWRIAFLVGAGVVPLGLALRSGLPETLVERPAGAVPGVPAGGLPAYRRVALLGLPLLAFGTISTYTVNYMATYAQATLGMSSAAGFGATAISGLIVIPVCPLAGLLSDRIGRRPVILAGMLILLLLTMPGFLLIGRYPAALPLMAVTALLSIGQAMGSTPVLAAVTEALPPRMRAGGVALIYALAITLFGGTTQFMIAWITKQTGSTLAPAWYLIGAALIGLAALALLPETAPVKRGDPGPAG